MEAINDIDGLLSTDLENKDDLFAFKISYNTPEDTNKALFNGNISETYWRTLYDDQQRKYEYTYDHLNRLLQADYSRPNTNIRNAYKEALTYDKNGNITTLVRNSFEDESYEYEIDNLVYAYDANNKNQLARVTDNSGWTDGFNENKDTNGYSANDTTDYTYDANGNMTSDENKGITSITYNHLNLPVKIVFDNDSNFRIEYLYDATGKKVAKKVHTKETVYFPCQGGGGGGESSRGTSTASVTQQCSSTSQVLEETDYLAGGFQYKFGQLEFFPHAEGFVKWDGGYAQYYFNYTDHLGNVRVTYYDDGSGTPVLWEESNYYPFGLKHKGYNEPEQYERYWGNGVVTNQSVNSNKYKYNGKELQDELGLNMYDYGARNYDAAIGRWMNIDPLAENSRRFSPYTYANNNPIFFIDPDGRYASQFDSRYPNSGDQEYDEDLKELSPIFDSKTGVWLGNDSLGFMRGDVLFMDKEKFDELSKASKNGKIDHKDAVKNSTSIADLKETPHDIALFHSAVDFVAKVTYKAFYDEDPTKGLYKGKISVSSAKTGMGVNNPDVLDIDTYGQNTNMAKGNPDIDKVTVNFDLRKDLRNAGNIGSLFEHEYRFHGIFGMRTRFNPFYDPHPKIYPLQAKTPLFLKYATGNFREGVLNKAKRYGN